MWKKDGASTAVVEKIFLRADCGGENITNNNSCLVIYQFRPGRYQFEEKETLFKLEKESIYDYNNEDNHGKFFFIFNFCRNL